MFGAGYGEVRAGVRLRNRLGVGAQGLGGLTTVLDVKIKDYPTHAANKAVAILLMQGEDGLQQAADAILRNCSACHDTN